ncbi:MAG TPA: hypothetical protein VN038_01540 [Dyadobacter sp.]|nr:hypothetical protein [Dyadobacter sp.]
MATIKVKTANQVRQFNFEKPTSWNLQERSFSAVAFSEEPVFIPYPEPYFEILSHEPHHIRMTRAMSGLPVLDDHNKYGIGAQIGAAANPVLRNRQLHLDVRLSKRKQLDDLAQDIDDGIVKNMSGGYRVFKYEDLTQPGDRFRTLRAIDWEPHEFSFTPVNFDHNSQIRSMPNTEESEIEIQTNNMAGETTAVPQAAAEGTPAPAVVTNPAQAAPVAQVAPVAEGTRALPTQAVPAPQAPAPVTAPADPAVERTRALQIMQIANAAQMGQEFIEQHIGLGSSVEQVRSLAFNKLTGQSTVETQTNQRTAPANVTVGTEQIEHTRRLMSIGLCLRHGIKPNKPYTDDELRGAEQYRHMRSLEMARLYMGDNGHPEALRMPENELAKRALISSNSTDFAVILEGAARTSMEAQYSILSRNWRDIAGTGSVSDFREWKRMRTGFLGRLDKVGENGEFKNKPIPDGALESVKIGTYGNTVNVTRQMLINDDLGYFLTLAGMLAQAAGLSIETDVWEMLQANGGLGPTMADGNPLIHASRGNVGAAGAYSTTTINDGRTKMRLQKDLNNQEYLNIAPDRVIVPFALEETAISLNINDYQAGDGKQTQKNLYKGLFKQIITNPRLTSATRFWMLTDPAILKVFEVNFLNGNETPFMDERQEFYVDGTVWRIRHDWGVAAVESKGIVGFAGA